MLEEKDTLETKAHCILYFDLRDMDGGVKMWTPYVKNPKAVGLAASVGRADFLHGVLAAGLDAGHVGGVRRQAGRGAQAQPQPVGCQDRYKVTQTSIDCEHFWDSFRQKF